MIVHENSYWNLSYAFWCRSWQFGLIDGVTVTTWIQAKRISYPRSLFVAICVNWWICCRDITLAHSTHKIWIFNMNSLSPYLSSYPCRARSVCVCHALSSKLKAEPTLIRVIHCICVTGTCHIVHRAIQSISAASRISIHTRFCHDIQHLLFVLVVLRLCRTVMYTNCQIVIIPDSCLL